MSRKINTATSETDKIAVPKYLIISFLTIFAIGPQYFLNLSYTMNREIIQYGLTLGSTGMLLPSTLSNIGFAFGVPLGPALSRRFGLRKSYLILVFIFLIGSVINLLSEDLFVLTLGRVIQGISSGMLFLTILPVSLMSFPNKIRNTFLFMVISGLFGASALGALFGSVSLSLDSWRWLFILSIIASIGCLLVGLVGLPKHTDHSQDHKPIDKMGLLLLTLIVIVFAVPAYYVVNKGFHSVYVWPFLVAGLILLFLFIYNDLNAEMPLVPFRSLKAPKPISGTVMAVASHLSLVVSIAAINGFMRNNVDVPFRQLTYFYLFFFVGVLITAILKTFLYDVLGAGVLGMIGSLAVIYVSLQWRVVTPDISYTRLYFDIAFLGAGVSMVLVSGALGTALAGDIHKASQRSLTLHSIRNFMGALASPVIGWFLTRQNMVNYESIANGLNQYNGTTRLALTNAIRHFMALGHSASEAQSLAVYQIIVNSKKSAALGAYHNLFTVLMVLGIIMFLASIGKTATGKGRSLVQKPAKVQKAEVE